MNQIDKKIRDSAGKIRKNINMNHLIESSVLKKEFTKMMSVFGIKIPLYITTDRTECPTACTTSKWIMINPLSSFADGLQLPQQLMVAYGELIHEIGHCLFTDFKAHSRFIDSFINGNIPFDNLNYTDEDNKNLDSIKSFLTSHESGGTIIAGLFRELMNITEDSHIEPRIIALKPGWGVRYLGFFRQIHSAKAPYVEDFDNSERPLYVAFANTYLHYAKFGILQYENSNHMLIKLIDKVSEFTEHAIFSMRYTTRAEYTWRVFVRLWSDVFEEIANDQKAQAEFEKLIQDMLGPSPSGSSSNSSHQKDGMCSPSGPSATARRKVVIRKTKSDSESSGSSSNSDENESEKDKGANSKHLQHTNSNYSEDNEAPRSNDVDMTDSDESDESESNSPNCVSDASAEPEDDSSDVDSKRDGTSDKENSSTDSNSSDCNKTSCNENAGAVEEGESESTDAEEVETESGDTVNTGSSDDNSSSDKSTDEQTDNNTGSSSEATDNTMLDNRDSSESTDEHKDEASAQSDECLPPDKGQTSSTETVNINAEEGGRFKKSDGIATELANENMGTTEYEDYLSDQDFELTEKDIEHILNEAANKIAEQNCERDFCNQLEKSVNSITYPDIHKYVRKKINRIRSVTPSMQYQYNAIISNPEVKKAIASLTRYFQSLFKAPNYQSPRTSGIRLNKKSYKNEDITGKIFVKELRDKPSMCLAIRIDESASMSSNNRAYHARIVAIIIQAVCESLNIPVLIYGDISDKYTGRVDLFSYSDFNSVDGNDKYRLVDISARNGCNRDGAAIQYLASRLAERPERHKILLSISDGQPNSLFYTGTAAINDIKSIIQHFRQKGIVTFGAAIGDDKEKIRECYGNGFLDVSCIRELPVTLYNIIKTKITK